MSDYVERVAAIAAIRDLYPGRPWLKRNFEWWSQKNKAYIECENAVQSLPATDVAPVRHGRWIKNDNGTWSCKRCHSWIPDEQHYYARFCLYCGAKMDGGADDD